MYLLLCFLLGSKPKKKMSFMGNQIVRLNGAKEGLRFWKGAKALLHPENCILEWCKSTFAVTR
ncbi:hypothetical protein LguiA_008356 [Lonicera macranthoides]